MPVLHTETKIERVYLPSTKDAAEADKAFVDIETGPLTAGDIVGVDPKASDTESAIRMLSTRIKGWNFTDADGQDVEVNFDNISKLKMEDFAFLAEQITTDLEGLSTPEKKT